MSTEISRFAKIISTLALVLVLIAGYPLYRSFGSNVLIGFLSALLITFLNAGIGYYFIDRYFRAPLKTFMKAVFLNMGLRLLAIALILVALIGFTKIHKVSFTVSLFISYILFSVIEIYFINKKASKPNT